MDFTSIQINSTGIDDAHINTSFYRGTFHFTMLLETVTREKQLQNIEVLSFFNNLAANG